jgi:hypothetical protein
MAVVIAETELEIWLGMMESKMNTGSSSQNASVVLPGKVIQRRNRRKGELVIYGTAGSTELAVINEDNVSQAGRSCIMRLARNEITCSGGLRPAAEEQR